MKKKVLVVSDRIAPFFLGGYEIMFLEYLEILGKKFDVSVLTALGDNYDIRHNSRLGIKEVGILDKVEIMPLNTKSSFTNKNGIHSILGTFVFITLLRASTEKLKGYDIVLINTIPYFGIAGVIRRLKKNNGTVLSLFNEAWYNYPYGNFFFFVFRLVLRRFIKSIVKYSDHIISISSPVSDSLLTNYKAPPEKLHTIPNGYSEHTPSNSSEKIYDIAFVGRLSAIKRIPDLLRAIHKLSRSGVSTKTVIIGDGPLITSLKEETRKRGIAEMIDFAGRIEGYEKMELISKAILFVMPSEREGFSNATMEAMSLGVVPIVAKPKFDELFGISHYLEEGVNGLTYDVGNSNELAEKIRELRVNKRKLEEMSKKAVLTSTHFTWNDSKEKLAKLFDELSEKK